ncbi:hypothetical protein, partial [Aeromonas salmonicida]|uniref:hypothetical protein n=1 Tax=Aeromonas salmonicida TaxID=645 RepID=UPI00224058AD
MRYPRVRERPASYQFKLYGTRNEGYSLFLIMQKVKGTDEVNASQLSLTGIVFIGFFYTVFLWPWLHAAGVTSFPSCRQHKLP